MQQVCIGLNSEGKLFIRALARHLREGKAPSRVNFFVKQGERKSNVGLQLNKKCWVVVD